jgi:hypothetical protein
VRINRGAARRLVMQSATEFVTDVMRKTQNRSKAITPVDQGILRAEQHVKVVSRGTRVHGTLTALPDYALPVHEGWSRTRPILPKRGQALKFKINGQTVIVKRVISPASYAGRPFLYLALAEVAGAAGFRVYRVTP